MFAVAVVITKSRVVRTAEWQGRLQLSLLLPVGCLADTLHQLLQFGAACKCIVLRERAFCNECPVLLSGSTVIKCY